MKRSDVNYLKKLIHEETIEAKKIVLSENMRQYVLEQEGNISDVDNPVKPEDEDPEKNWEGAELTAAKWLEDIGATKVSLGPNPYGYIVVCKIKKMDGSEGKEKLRFYEDGDVYSYNLAQTIGWKLENNVMKINNISDTALNPFGYEKKELGYIDTTKPITFIVTSEAEEEEYTEAESWQDRVQTVLDWLGFLPGIGDVIDLINGTWYFARGKWFDGALSMIAIIPFIGSVLKTSVKTVAKATGVAKITKYFRKMFTVGGDKAATKLWAEMIAKGELDLKKLSLYQDGFESLANLGSKTKNIVRNFPGNTSSAKYVESLADQAILFAKNSGKGIDDVFDAVRKAEKTLEANKAALRTAESGAATSKLAKFGNRLTLNVFPTLKKAGKWPEKQLSKMADITKQRFVKRIGTNPSKIGILATTSGREMKNILSSNSFDILKKISKEDSIKLAKDLEKAGFDRLIKKGTDGRLLKIDFNKLETATDGADLFTLLGKQPGKEFGTLSDSVIKQSIDGSHPAWTRFKDNEFNTLLSSTAWGSGIKTSIYKNFDIISNEIQDIGQDLGFGPDANEGVVYPIAKEMFDYTLGDTAPVQRIKSMAAWWNSPDQQQMRQQMAGQTVETLTAGYLKGSDVAPLDTYEFAADASVYEG